MRTAARRCPTREQLHAPRFAPAGHGAIGFRFTRWRIRLVAILVFRGLCRLIATDAAERVEALGTRRHQRGIQHLDLGQADWALDERRPVQTTFGRSFDDVCDRRRLFFPCRRKRALASRTGNAGSLGFFFHPYLDMTKGTTGYDFHSIIPGKTWRPSVETNQFVMEVKAKPASRRISKPLPTVAPANRQAVALVAHTRSFDNFSNKYSERILHPLLTLAIIPFNLPPRRRAASYVLSVTFQGKSS